MTNLKRQIGLAGLIFIGVNSMIGSGWLFGSFFSAQLAGPSAILAWIIAALISLIIALPFAEIGSMLPLSGSFARAAYLTHGHLSGYLIGCIAWLSMVCIAPIEVQGILLYAANYFPELMQKSQNIYVLSNFGLMIAIGILFLFTLINYFSIVLVNRFNSIFTIWKIIIPTVVIILFIILAMHTQNFTSHGFFVNGSNGLLKALVSGGIIYSFFGFRQVVAMAGEVKNPGKTIPCALILSLLLVALIYIGLQIAFIGALPPAAIAQGWPHLSYLHDKGPLAGLAANLGLIWLAGILYFDAVISPMGTGLIYTTTTTRVLLGMAEDGDLPKSLMKLNRFEIPVSALLINFLVGILFIYFFSAWQLLSSFIVLVLAIGYGITPISLNVLRSQLPKYPRPFRLVAGRTISLIAFIVCNILAYLTGWQIYRHLLGFTLLVLCIFLLRNLYKKSFSKINLTNGLWIIIYLLGMGLISYLGMYGAGKKILMHYEDFVAIILWSVMIYCMAWSSRLPAEIVKNSIEKINTSDEK